MLYLCGTSWHLGGTYVVPMWYMFDTCPCRPEQVFKLLHDLGRSLYIACWQYYLLVPGWYHVVCGTWVVPMLLMFGTSAASVWYQCGTHLVFMLTDLGRSSNCRQTCAGLFIARSQ